MSVHADQSMTFKAENFDQMHATFMTRAQEVGAGEAGGRGGGRAGVGGGGRAGRGRGTNIADAAHTSADIIKFSRMIKQLQLKPIIICSFARR